MKKLIDIIGFEGWYHISSDGKVYRLPRKKRLVNGKFQDLPRIELQVNSKVQYPCVSLNKNGKQKTFYMHRLVAIHFVHNDDPLFKREVNHKDGNIFNYAANNLEWCTRAENVKHAKRKKK